MGNYHVAIITSWIQSCGYTSSSYNLELELLSHPDFPSLNSITESLQRIGVEVSAVKVEKSLLPEFEGSFLAYLIKDGIPALVLVKDKKKNENFITIMVDKGTYIKLNSEEFISQWNGIVVAIEERQRNIKNRLLPFKKVAPAILLVSVLIFCFFNGEFGLWTSANFILSLIGFTVCVVILAHEQGSSVASKFCTEGKHTSCNAVLNSSAAKLPFGVGLSDVGITYFSTLIIYWLLASINGSLSIAVYGVAVIAFFAIPFTLFSITYQGLVVKKFCPLCLSVVAVLWLQAVTFIPYLSTITVVLATRNIALFAGIALTLFLLWSMLKPLLILQNQSRLLLLDSVTFRRSYQLFLPWFSQAQAINLANIPEVRLGNSNAPIQLLAISNPLCIPCASAHNVYEELMLKYSGQINLSIRFYVPLDNPNDPRMVVAARLMELFSELTENSFSIAVHQWYQSQDYVTWIKKWGIPHTVQSVEALFVQKKWCHDNGIVKTPVLLVNGILIPHYYQPTDIAAFIEPLLKMQGGVYSCKGVSSVG